MIGEGRHVHADLSSGRWCLADHVVFLQVPRGAVPSHVAVRGTALLGGNEKIIVQRFV